MKSLLVDALRQANSDESDQVLSDSGSFDATSEDFGATANDELGSDLELMSTTKSLVLPAEPSVEAANESGNDEVTDERTDESAVDDTERGASPNSLDLSDSATNLSLTGVLVAPASVGTEPMPRLARHSPLICVVLAALVAGTWLLYEQVGAARDSASLGAIVARTHSGDSDDATLQVQPAERFPFLSGEPAASERTTQ